MFPGYCYNEATHCKGSFVVYTEGDDVEMFSVLSKVLKILKVKILPENFT